ncbi:Vesicle transport protein SFT2B-like protein [Drosera capensis]
MWKLSRSIFTSQDEERQEERGESFFDEDINGICNLSPIQATPTWILLIKKDVWVRWMLGGWLRFDVPGKHELEKSLIVFAKPIKFALLFTFGNVLAVGSTAFIIGPTQQLRMMFDPVRRYATAVYIGFVVLALICALLIHSKILTILAIICEICALVWYSLSYIPFARSAVSNLMIRVFDTEI